MIISKLCGGIGNQLFQYGYGLSQAKRLTTEFKLNTQILENTPASWTKYVYELGCFEGITENIDNVSNLTDVGESGVINDNSLLGGYYQNVENIKTVKEELKEKLKFKETMLLPNSDGKNTVSIHARRGDYLNGNHFVNLADTNYYQEAVKHINSVIENPTYYIFSNDLAWAQNYFSFISEDKVFMCNSTSEDLQNMSLCANNITANSTFSWWGAWLNKNKNKIIIQPKQWYTGNPNFNDLYMERSVKI